MKCSSMKLANRKKEQLISSSDVLQTPGTMVVSDQFHCYSFRWDKNKKSRTDQGQQPYLSIKNIVLPDGAKTFNTGSSNAKWSQKPPRLKSSKCNNAKAHRSPDRISETDVFVFLQEPKRQDDIPPDTRDAIDPDIQLLINQTHENKSNEEESARKKKKSAKNDRRKKRRKLTKTITFSLSRAPSPETTQIIRVDLTSNYSVEECENSSREQSAKKGESEQIEDARPKKSNGFQIFGEKIEIKQPKC